MIKLEYYFHKENTDPKMVLSLDWFTLEDHWYQRYILDRPLHPDDRMELLKQKNLDRCKWFTIRLNVMHYRISVDFKLKKIGNLYYGRLLQDAPRAHHFKRHKRKKEQQ